MTPMIDSVAYLTLARHVRDNGQDGEALDTALWLIGAHPDLIAHGVIFENLLGLLRMPTFAEQNLFWAGEWTPWLDRIRGLLTWLLAEKARLAVVDELGQFYAIPTNKAQHPLVGAFVDRHPLAAALWNRPDARTDVAAALAYVNLQSHVLAMYAESRTRAAHGRDDFFRYTGAREFAAIPMNGGPVGRALRALADSAFAPLMAFCVFRTV